MNTIVQSLNHWADEMAKAADAVAEMGAHVEIIDGNRAISETCRAAAVELTAERERFNLLSQRCAQAEERGDAATSEAAKQRIRADSLLAALVSLRERCDQQRAEWLKETRSAPSKMIQASCAMAAGSFGTVLEWVEEAIAAGGAS
ncbi:MAG: hypothetical protein JNK15_10245 [Planctomycetes bacterium]|nr:hypothetical protein [Planctomycetota bacterium]